MAKFPSGKIIRFPPGDRFTADENIAARRAGAIEMRQLKELERVIRQQPLIWWFDHNGFPITTSSVDQE